MRNDRLKTICFSISAVWSKPLSPDRNFSAVGVTSLTIPQNASTLNRYETAIQHRNMHNSAVYEPLRIYLKHEMHR
jgi:hypothetical protein